MRSDGCLRTAGQPDRVPLRSKRSVGAATSPAQAERSAVAGGGQKVQSELFASAQGQQRISGTPIPADDVA